MTWTATLGSFALGAAFAAPIPAAAQANRKGPSVAELRQMVEQREQEAAAAEAALALARSRLAHAEGKPEQAAAEGRKVVRYYEGKLKVVREFYASGRACIIEPLQEAEGEAAIARAWLAEVENRRDDLRTELPKVITHCDQRIRYYQGLLQHKLIDEVEAQVATKRFEEERRSARERLTALGKDAIGADEPGKGGKP
jgi:hypothetical protein